MNPGFLICIIIPLLSDLPGSSFLHYFIEGWRERLRQREKRCLHTPPELIDLLLVLPITFLYGARGQAKGFTHSKMEVLPDELNI